MIFMGPFGGGKTSVIRQLIAAGLQVRGIFTEPSFEVVTDITCEQGFHYTYIQPVANSWADILENARMLNTLPFKVIMGMDNFNKTKYTGFLDFIRACNDFTCHRCGQKFGSMETWSTGVAAFIDGLTGLSEAAMQNVVGGKPVKDKPDWQSAMDQVKVVVNNLAISPHCHVILTAHTELELDEVAGTTKAMVATLGRKLAPQIPRYYSDVILSQRVNATTFKWSTVNSNYDLKTRNFPYAESVPVDMKAPLKVWQSRGGIVEPV